jgi:hypothetical protein
MPLPVHLLPIVRQDEQWTVQAGINGHPVFPSETSVVPD